jgi:hypothetical protein
MVEKQGTDVEARSNSRGLRGSIGSLLLRVASQIFGGSVVTTKPKTKSEAQVTPSTTLPAPSHSAAEAADNLEQTLEHFESMLEALENQVETSAKSNVESEASASAEVADLKRTLNEMFERMEGALDRITTQAERLADGASDLADVAGRVEARMNEITRALREAASTEPVQASPPVAPAAPAAPVPAAPAKPPEPQFRPGTSPMSVVLATVPGFQGLMDIQRALSGLPQTEGASVVAYKNGEASLEVTLTAPLTAREIVDGLRDATGEQLLIEESRPEAGKLRLRFVERDSGTTA